MLPARYDDDDIYIIESLLFGSFFFLFFFQEPLCFVFCFVLLFFYVTILKFVDNFSKRIICIILSTLGSRPNYYQGNLYAIFK